MAKPRRVVDEESWEGELSSVHTRPPRSERVTRPTLELTPDRDTAVDTLNDRITAEQPDNIADALRIAAEVYGK